MIIHCEVYVPGRAWAQCGESAVALVRAGCVHEHIVERPVCEDHKEIAGAAGCMRCITDAENPHECAMVGQLLDLAELIR